jgi:hypothetical protein
VRREAEPAEPELDAEASSEASPPAPAEEPEPDDHDGPPLGPGGTVPASELDRGTEEWGFDEEEEPEPEPAEPEEDVLEETPEFLSETPEHDRLWFEQRPPRDFDFDG